MEMIRKPEAVKGVWHFAPTIILQAIRHMTLKHRVGETDSLSRWYREEIREKFRFTTSED